MGNSMAKCILSYYLQHVEDPDIKTLLENALRLSEDFIKETSEIFTKENFPIPKGFGEEDVNLNAPRLFQDEYYPHYLKYAAKAGLSIYSVAIPMQMLHDENLPTPSFLDDLVTKSTFPPFSDKIMLFHKMDMFSMKMRAFGNSVAVNGRHDVGFLYTRSFMKIGRFVEDAAKIYIEKGWMERAPHAVNRDQLEND
jgi:hypothetical protein